MNPIRPDIGGFEGSPWLKIFFKARVHVEKGEKGGGGRRRNQLPHQLLPTLSTPLITPPLCHNLERTEELVCSNDPRRYTDGSVATARASIGGQGRDRQQAKRGCCVVKSAAVYIYIVHREIKPEYMFVKIGISVTQVC